MITNDKEPYIQSQRLGSAMLQIEVLMGTYPNKEKERRQHAVTQSASSDTKIVFTELPVTFYDAKAGAVTAKLIEREICKAALAAESRGSAAVVPFGTLDAGVETARHFVDIPVIGAGSSGYHIAAMLGESIGVVVYQDHSIWHAYRMADRQGMRHKVASCRAIQLALSDQADSREELNRRLIECSRAAIADGADVLLPQGVSMVPVHFSAAELAGEIGIPVVDALAASIATAELMARTGVTNSRVAYPRAPADIL